MEPDRGQRGRDADQHRQRDEKRVVADTHATGKATEQHPQPRPDEGYLSPERVAAELSVRWGL